MLLLLKLSVKGNLKKISISHISLLFILYQLVNSFFNDLTFDDRLFFYFHNIGNISYFVHLFFIFFCFLFQYWNLLAIEDDSFHDILGCALDGNWSLVYLVGYFIHLSCNFEEICICFDLFFWGYVFYYFLLLNGFFFYWLLDFWSRFFLFYLFFIDFVRVFWRLLFYQGPFWYFLFGLIYLIFFILLVFWLTFGFFLNFVILFLILLWFFFKFCLYFLILIDLFLFNFLLIFLSWFLFIDLSKIFKFVISMIDRNLITPSLSLNLGINWIPFFQ